MKAPDTAGSGAEILAAIRKAVHDIGRHDHEQLPVTDHFCLNQLCWIGGHGQWLLDAIDARDAKLAEYGEELRLKRNDLLNVRGAMSPNGQLCKVPMEIADEVAPAVEWLLAERDRLTDLVDRFDYVEEFHCAATPAGEEDHEHDRDLPCQWGFRCSVCHADVNERPCAEHAPREVPGLRLADCTANPPHVTYGHEREDYGLPCPWCQLAERAERDRLARQCRHWGWRRWAVTRWAEGWAYRLGITSGGGAKWGDGCNWCVDHIRFTGRRVYLLGVPRGVWRCWARGHRRGVEVLGFDSCGTCTPWTCCGSTGVDHTPACPDVNNDSVTPLTAADVARIYDVPAELLAHDHRPEKENRHDHDS